MEKLIRLIWDTLEDFLTLKLEQVSNQLIQGEQIQKSGESNTVSI